MGNAVPKANQSFVSFLVQNLEKNRTGRPRSFRALMAGQYEQQALGFLLAIRVVLASS